MISGNQELFEIKKMLWFRLALFLVVVGGCFAKLLDTEENGKEAQWREAWEKLAALETQYRDNGTGCQCINYNCGCCVHLDVEKISVNTTACVNASYLPDQYGISLTFSLGKKVYINETISAKNPPLICFGIPDFEKDASICLDFYDLDYTSTAFTGCIKLEARLFHVLVRDVELGCFSFPLAKSGSRPWVPLTKAKRIQTSPKLNEWKQNRL